MKVTFLKNIWAWITGAAKKVKEALDFGKETANDIKKYADSPLLDYFVKATKNPYDDAALIGIRAGLEWFINAMGWADKKISDFDEVTKKYVLANIAAEAGYLKAEADKLGTTREQHIAAAPVVYDPKIV